ncbi:MAG: ATP-binding protein [Chitinophagaceae bacterium]
MKLRTKYIMFVTFLHGVALVLSFFIFKENKVLFIASEIVIIVSLVFSWQLYNELIQPLKTLIQGADAMKDRDFSTTLRSTGKYELDRLIQVFNQMMDELRKERTKQEMQHLFLEKLINTSPTGILILDYSDFIQLVNPKALQLLGLEENEIAGKSIEDISHPVITQVKDLQSGLAKTVTFNGGITYKLHKSHFMDRGFPRHFVMIEELTAEILAAEKKTYGKVIRMMAHEVNNTIGPVNSIIQSTIQSKTHPDILDNALRVAMERNNNLNQFMRNFADLVRIPPPVKKPLDLILLVQNVTELMRLRAGEKKIEFVIEHERPVMMINADVQQMEQVLINIIKNAMEAIDRKGRITIRSYCKPLKLIIRDTGSGVSPEASENLFSPFYSTKKGGQGVGLTVTREILSNHGFEFSLRTVEETEFVVEFG